MKRQHFKNILKRFSASSLLNANNHVSYDNKQLLLPNIITIQEQYLTHTQTISSKLSENLWNQATHLTKEEICFSGMMQSTTPSKNTEQS